MISQRVQTLTFIFSRLLIHAANLRLIILLLYHDWTVTEESLSLCVNQRAVDIKTKLTLHLL